MSQQTFRCFLFRLADKYNRMCEANTTTNSDTSKMREKKSNSVVWKAKTTLPHTKKNNTSRLQKIHSTHNPPLHSIVILVRVVVILINSLCTLPTLWSVTHFQWDNNVCGSWFGEFDCRIVLCERDCVYIVKVLQTGGRAREVCVKHAHTLLHFIIQKVRETRLFFWKESITTDKKQTQNGQTTSIE